MPNSGFSRCGPEGLLDERRVGSAGTSLAGSLGGRRGARVAIGGITRLTESGLSITEWRPVSGVLPPVSDAAWQDAYARYLTIPQAQSLHRGITMAEFRAIFWWEWFHRLSARSGRPRVLALPYFVLLARGQLRAEHRWRLLLLPVLAAAQGALGWYMVKSGLAGRSTVSQYRLTAHLGMALVIYTVCIWTVLDLGARKSHVERISGLLRRAVPWALGLTLLTILSGGFVAGLRGGLMFNTFPLMGGQVAPPGYQMSGFGWRNAFENPIAAQFHHRLLALGTATLIIWLAALGRRPGVPESLKRATTAASLAVCCRSVSASRPCY
ncbi:MAG: COX15/CtaA family protein [Gemmatimonadetes bacterium]|nr:COX15/CtaA family protein [Gemmatimonadota bacterium]